MYLTKSTRIAASFRAVVVLALAFLFLNGWAGDPFQDTIPVQLIVVESQAEAARILEQLKRGEDLRRWQAKSQWTRPPSTAVSWET